MLQNFLGLGEAYFQRLVQIIPDMMFRISREGIFLGYKAAEDISFYAPPEYFLGKNIRDVMPHNHAKRSLHFIELACKTNKPQYFEYSLEIESSIRHYEARLVHYDSNEVFAMIRDITIQKEFANRLHFQVAFQKLVSNISGTFLRLSPHKIDEGILHSLQLIGSFAHVDRCYLFEIRDNALFNTHEWCEENVDPYIDKLQNIPPNNFPWFMEKMNRFETVHIPDVSRLPKEAAREKKEYESENIVSLLCVPLVYQNQLVGFVGFDSVKEIKTWSEESIQLLKLVAEMFVSALERKRLYQSLKMTERNWYSLLRQTPDFIIKIDLKGTVLFTNQTVAGVDMDDVIGASLFDFVEKKDHAKVKKALKKVFETQKLQKYSVKGVGPNESVSFYETVVMPFHDEGKLTAYTLMSRDITDRKTPYRKRHLDDAC